VTAAYCLAMADARVRLPLGAFRSAYGKAWQFRSPRRQIVGSNPTAPTRLRWGPCWYGQAPVKRTDTGSIPVTAAERKNLRGRLTVGSDALNVLMLVRFQPPQLQRKSSGWMRTLSRKQLVARATCGFESHGFRL